MEFEKVKDKLGSWAEVLAPFVTEAQFDQIFVELRNLARRGRVVCPDSSRTFRAFTQTPYQKLKAVFIIDGPYTGLSGDKTLADGIALSSTDATEMPVAQSQFYRSIEREITGGLDLDMRDAADLGYLSAQGVLLLNTALTTEMGKPGSHVELWRPFMSFLLTDVINAYRVNLPVVLAGPGAHSYAPLIIPFVHTVFQLCAPGNDENADAPWESKGVFSAINQIIKSNNGQPISWLAPAPGIAAV